MKRMEARDEAKREKLRAKEERMLLREQKRKAKEEQKAAKQLKKGTPAVCITRVTVLLIYICSTVTLVIYII